MLIPIVWMLCSTFSGLAHQIREGARQAVVKDTGGSENNRDWGLELVDDSFTAATVGELDLADDGSRASRRRGRPELDGMVAFQARLVATVVDAPFSYAASSEHTCRFFIVN